METHALAGLDAKLTSCSSRLQDKLNRCPVASAAATLQESNRPLTDDILPRSLIMEESTFVSDFSSTSEPGSLIVSTEGDRS
ncbi:hypothetical protein MTO96_052328 [Rhipicephalus appendiculatus]